MLTFGLGGRLALAYALAMLFLLAMAASGVAYAEDERALVYFDLPAQPLERALSEFGRLTGYSVLVDSAMTQGRTIQAIRGNLEPQNALRQLLAGTGLSARYSGRNAFTLQPDIHLNERARAAANDAESVETTNAQRAPSLAGMPDDAAANFAAALQGALTRAMCTAQPDAVGRYRAAMQLWLGPDGRILRARLLESTGLSTRDAQLVAIVKGVRVGQMPPPGLAQPLTILLSPRSDPAAVCREAARAVGG